MLFALLAKKEYTDDSGTQHKRWYKAGSLKETEVGARYLTLFHQPETTFILVPDDHQESVIQLDD